MKIEDAVRKSGGVWPKRLLSKGAIDVMLWDGSDGCIKACTRTEFEECARRLRNEPSWDAAPDWAVAKAQNGSGWWYWYEFVPRLSTTMEIFRLLGGRTSYAGEGEVIGNWRDTLRLRPEEKSMEDKNDWHKRGELPPVGTVCQYTAIKQDSKAAIIPGHWYRGTIIAYHDGYVWTSDNGIRRLSNTKFRPLQTDRERTEELHYLGQMLAATAHDETDRIQAIIDRLIELLAKMPETKQ